MCKSVPQEIEHYSFSYDVRELSWRMEPWSGVVCRAVAVLHWREEGEHESPICLLISGPASDKHNSVQGLRVGTSEQPLLAGAQSNVCSLHAGIAVGSGGNAGESNCSYSVLQTQGQAGLVAGPAQAQM